MKKLLSYTTLTVLLSAFLAPAGVMAAGDNLPDLAAMGRSNEEATHHRMQAAALPDLGALNQQKEEETRLMMHNALHDPSAQHPAGPDLGAMNRQEEEATRLRMDAAARGHH